MGTLRKIRLDQLLVDRQLAPTRSQARSIIMAGEVLVDDQLVDRPGKLLEDSVDIKLAARPRYVSRGGDKLAGTLDEFSVSVGGKTCADVGACTGGFTDVLLQRGAKRVFAIDVGRGQLHWKLRQDPRVVVLEGTNARYLDALPEKVALAVVDVSFISLRLILAMVGRWLRPGADLIALVKPQFEAGRRDVGKGGIVRDPSVWRGVLHEIVQWCQANQFHVHGISRSPITGAGGNVEFFVWLGCQPMPIGLNVEAAIETAVGAHSTLAD